MASIVLIVAIAGFVAAVLWFGVSLKARQEQYRSAVFNHGQQGLTDCDYHESPMRGLDAPGPALPVSDNVIRQAKNQTEAACGGKLIRGDHG